MLQRAHRYCGKWDRSSAVNTGKACGSLTLAGSLFKDKVGPVGSDVVSLLFHQHYLMYLRPGKILSELNVISVHSGPKMKEKKYCMYIKKYF